MSGSFLAGTLKVLEIIFLYFMAKTVLGYFYYLQAIED